MASNLKYSTGLQNARLNAITTYAGASGFRKIYSGVQPANANTALSGNTLLATLTLNATYAGAAASNLLTLNSIASDTNAAATGTAAFFRDLKSDATTVVMDGTVGTSGCDMNLNSIAIQVGTTVACTSSTVADGNS